MYNTKGDISVSYLQVLEGYGQTECGAICSLQMPGDGTIGKTKHSGDTSQ